MRNGIITIMKKELARFFGDRRMVVSILMPGVLLYIMYSFICQDLWRRCCRRRDLP